MSHQVRAASQFAAILLLIAGCQSPRAGTEAWTPVTLRATETSPRVIVYGAIGELLPRSETTPALQMLLYGPTRERRPILRNPQGLTRIGDQLLICDQGRADVIQFDSNAGRTRGWADPDHPPRCPVDILAGPDGRVYVADTTTRSVLVYDSGGKFLQELIPSDEPRRTFRPAALAIREGRLYVGDIGNHRVEVYDVDAGRWFAPITGPRHGRPIAAPTGLAFTPDSVLLIVDSLHGMIFRLTRAGEWLAPIGSPGRQAGQFVRPKQVCCTSAGLVLVTDAARQSVVMFRADGTYLSEIHEQQGVWSGWTLPASVLALQPSDLPVIEPQLQARGWELSAEYVIVSDALGARSLVLIGIGEKAAEVAHAP